MSALALKFFSSILCALWNNNHLGLFLLKVFISGKTSQI
ncbi:hypothetical protein NSP_14520 [Nodularia spumigena CCY9414]|nr:hypothetical protein NSP_14520 [Nodularia spumigena CCY9414]